MSEIHMTTISGRRFDLANPRAEDVVLSDVVTHLERINRFNGGTIRPYNVLEHSILVALECWSLAPLGSASWGLEQRQIALLGLFHDAAEAYTGDITSPIKQLIGKTHLSPLKKIEEVVEVALLGEKLGSRADLRALFHERYVKPADLAMLRWEQANLRIGWAPQAQDDITPYPLIEPGEILRDMPASRRFAFYSLHDALTNGEPLPLWTGVPR